MNRVPLTIEGARRLREELEFLKSVKRPQVIQAIAEARAHGDLRENAEYAAAREQQSFIEGRIKELEAALASAEIIDPSKISAGGRIVFGAIVELLDLHSEETMSFQIVGELEAEARAGRISVGSPLARALIGKHEGDTVEIQTPAGRKLCEIVAVRYR
ncbi:MAG: transcription elongation factor GreA [Lysobacterales bacterium]|jgi:transcription elongation factor GreA|nr:MAG: transcription elongation factor GreA [Xanthomonadales bacterium]